jgi:hypothetical protein
MFFKVSGYILNINSTKKKILLKINDDDELNRFKNNLIQFKIYSKEHLEKINNTFTLKFNNFTKFNISKYNYKNISDLNGVYITISGQTKYYCFSIDENKYNEITNNIITEKKIKSGYILLCNNIKN